MLQADAISMQYETPTDPLIVLRDVCLTLADGESASIIGPSGSGKSTLLNILGSLEPPTSGSVIIDGCNPYSLTEPELARFRNRQVGFVFQDHHLLPQCTVLENVLLPALADKSSGSGRIQRARILLDRVGLAERLDHRPSQISGGERQRVALARALINEPALILADEPTGSLDRSTSQDVADLLWELHRQEGRILIVVTHNETLAARAGKRFELKDGVLAQLGS
ncbi:MAG: ABC transporter ATP-binding protein [Planctomycetes bacterium]|nr:ABC transporter ATP-binding protein [Planctomycetota bacterium]